MAQIITKKQIIDARTWVLVVVTAILLGVEFFVVLLASLWFFLKCGRTPHSSFYNSVVPALLLSLTISTIIGLLRDNELSRALSSLYSIVILFAGFLFSISVIKFWRKRFLLYSLLDYSDFRDFVLDSIGRLGVVVINVSFISFIVGLIWFLISRESVLEIPTLLNNLKNSETEVLRYLSSTRIYRADWGFGAFESPRFIYFARWDTAGAIIVSLAGNFAAAFYWRNQKRKKFFLYEFITALLIISTLSRTIVATHIVCTILSYMILFRNGEFVALIFVYVIGAIGLLVLVTELNIIENAKNFRSYSTNDRFDLYFAAIDRFSISNPFFGVGYKPKDSVDFQYAVGSHSLIFSYLIRGGLVGLTFAVFAFWIYPLINVCKILMHRDVFSKAISPFVFRGLLVLLVWTVFQEIDTSMITFTVIMMFLVTLEIFARKGFVAQSDPS